MFHLVSYRWFRRTRNITELGGDYKEMGIFDLRIFFLGGVIGVPHKFYYTDFQIQTLFWDTSTRLLE